MKIIELYAENLKRLTAVQITPEGNLVQITGKNGQGKTSVLDAIWWALDGTKNVQTTPIRKGEERAIIRLDLGELKITRRFNAQDDGTYTTSIAVENGEGARFSSPQTMLDKLLGELTFDPLAFTRMKDRDQVLAMRSLVPDFDFDQSEADYKAAFDQRTEANRTAKAALASAQEIGKDLPEDIPELITDEKKLALQQAYEQATEESAALEAKYATKEMLEKRHAIQLKELEALKKQIADTEAEIAGIGEIPSLEESQAKIDAAREAMNAVSSANRVAEQAQRRDTLAKQAKAATAEADALTERMTKIKASAQEAIAQADMPVDGLSIEDGSVYLGGVPFDQASDAQQLQASIGIAMALNPKLKVIRVRDGSLLDQDAMKVLAEMAEAADYQIWIERVDSSGTIGFVLEDGHVKGQKIVLDPKPNKQPEPPESLQADLDAKWEASKSLFDDDRAE